MANKNNKNIDALYLDNTTNTSVDIGDNQKIDVDITLIDRNPNQPRKTFNEESLQEMANSVRQYGVLQPLIVVKNGGRFMIIAGERRFRACTLAGIKKVPVIVRDFTPQQIAEISLIENLHREDLNAIEQAEGIKELIETYGSTQQDAADRIGKSRSEVANILRLLDLPEEVKDYIRSGKLSKGHGKALLALGDKDRIIELAKETIKEGFSVRDVEMRAKLSNARDSKKAGQKDKSQVTLEMKELLKDMNSIFGTKVKIYGMEDKGRIIVDYFSRDDLERINALIQILKLSDKLQK